ncbi:MULTISPECIES: M15 family metallopeptidase [Rahnella]|jgi:peptidoglycan L-alanyl-D-glutamate endopeptidase CwlK|uniref:M15 family metallopeptidase n=1 Tax=Rahnella contaminans TaxID=2703882 RepID=A0A6M2BAD1_9GAMM|nr:MULTISPECIES: M15 family metallopeptidase [Rahnella]KAB8309399.1 M15 family peptidase [Rouxiella chamberiensis]MCS3425415.1 peptidoglycan L-alanyl-D-glutamate endopeptidase CwlK [Rahnella sp. BIGb0603]NGX89613.1 M15 family metallopeptidase [Rahnella contaminans]QLK62382.1 M15 family peptidase [Enterobacteriaceae bacterium Kacie_13]
MEHFKFSKSSEDNLKGVHPDLCIIMRKALALSPVDFGISEGLRNKKRQLELVAKGRSLTNNSRHITGHAVDIFALPNNAISWEFKYYQAIANIVFELSKTLSIEIEWGGKWDDLNDGTHFELSRKDYP